MIQEVKESFDVTKKHRTLPTQERKNTHCMKVDMPPTLPPFHIYSRVLAVNL